MWSRLTEYAAEMVAPPEAAEPNVGEELWSRFANIVAPPDGGSAPSSRSGKREKDELDEEDDEQERYISELERALLQKKKQNEQLEQRIRELEAQHDEPAPESATVEGSESEVIKANDEELARLAEELRQLKEKSAGEEEAKRQLEQQKAENALLQERLGALQREVEELNVQCGVLGAKLRETAGSERSDAKGDDDTAIEWQRESIYSELVQAALLLSRAAADGETFEVRTTEGEVAAQIQALADRLRERTEQQEALLAKLRTSLVSFFEMNGEPVASQGETFCADVQRVVGVLSHRLSRGKADAEQVTALEEEARGLREKDEKSQKAILALQTQLSGVQASKRKNDSALADREADMMTHLEKRDNTIASLQASEEQLKTMLAHLGKELEDAHNEADELEKVCRSQQQEIEKLERHCEEAADLQVAYEALQNRVRELEKSAQEYEQGYLELLQEAAAMKTKNEEEKAELVAATEAQVLSSEQQSLYELQARLSACEADKLVAIQDAERLQNELEALDKVLLQFRADHKQQRERLLELEQALEDARREDSSRHKASGTNESGVSEEDFRRVMEVLAKRNQECEQLREALENSAKRFSSETEVLDKRLAAQLVLSYLESDKKDEVLQLISKMMGFSEEQKRRAGILADGHVVIPGNGGGGLFSSLFGLHSSAPTTADASGESDKELGKLWTNFLVDDAKR